MNMLVDSSVILAILAAHPRGWKRARAKLRAASGGASTLLFDLPTYAEVALAFREMDALDEALEALGVRHAPMPREAAFLAGRAFFAYRRKGGTRRRPTTEFLVGAHATVNDLTILTRKPALYRKHFPRVRIAIPPEER